MYSCVKSSLGSFPICETLSHKLAAHGFLVFYDPMQAVKLCFDELTNPYRQQFANGIARYVSFV